MQDKIENIRTLKSPEKPILLSQTIQWLSGEGCGSWFHIEKAEKLFIISRYSPDGKLECKGIFEQTKGIEFDINVEYQFTYLSHCAEVKVFQNQKLITFNLIEKY